MTATAIALAFALAQTPEPLQPLPEAPVPVRSGVGFGISLLKPLNSDFGFSTTGYGGNISHWFTWKKLAGQTRFTMHTAAAPGGARYVDTVGDFGMFFLPLDLVATPMVGGGIGGRFRWVRSASRYNTVGQVLQLSVRSQREFADGGIEGYLRGGILIGRGWPASVTVSADYSISLVGLRTPRALIFGLGVIFL